MYSKITRVLYALINISFLREALSNKIGYYTVVAPGTIRSESVFHVSISLSDFHRSCLFNITLKNFNETAKIFEYEGIEVEPRTTQLVKLRAPYLTDKLGHLRVVGYRGITSSDSAIINLESNSYSIFIQTNKAKFKPGELVEFRVICIDQLTRPIKGNHKILVKITDGQDNLLKLVCDVKLVQGVFRSEFQLSDYPVLGEWHIKVEIDDDVVAEKSFEVARYVLPKFSVEIKTRTNVAIDEGKIILEISSNYFHGEPAKGNLTIFLQNIYTYSYKNDENIIKLTRTSQVIGNGTIILNFQNDLHLKSKLWTETPVIFYKFKVEATLVDELSEEQSRTEMEIAVHSHPYKIKLQAPELFESEVDIRFKTKVLITDLEDNPIHDSQNPIKILVECKKYSNADRFKSEYIYQIGNDFEIIEITNENFTTCDLHAEYRGIRSMVRKVDKNIDKINMDILTESPEVGKKLEIIVKSLDPLRNFSYEIVSKGDIIKSELIYVPDNQTSYNLRFNVTFLMVPKISIHIHRIENRKFIGHCKDIYIKRAFKNSIQIRTEEETQPGSSVHINITTDEGSYVGLLGIDHRILMENTKTTEDDLSEDNFYTKLQNYDSLSFESSKYSPGARAGLVTFTNALMPVIIRIPEVEGWGDGNRLGGDSDEKILLPKKYQKPTLEFPFIRKLFSESWLYKDFERTSAESFNFYETIPDTITTWAITGFSLNPKTGLTLTKNTTKLKVFQKFFISMDLPNLVKEGEIIEVPVYIRHNMSQKVWTNVTIQSDSEYFSSKNISKQIFASKFEKIKFYIRPRKQGRYNVNVKAVSSNASDAIQKILNVQPQGIPYEMSKQILVHLPTESTQNDEITIDIPEHAVSESQRIEISVVGDVFRPLLKTLQKMERVPYGNGEDNMKYIVSNLLVLKYLKVLNYSKHGLESKIMLNLELGYQNQLGFKHLDGSFGLFEQTIERTGDVWQTAFALWGLKMASNFIQIDIKIIKRGLEYLNLKQQENGCFESKKDIEEDVRVTAFVLMVLLMDNFSKTSFGEVISKGLQCLHDTSKSLELNSSNSVLSTYVLLLGNHEKAEVRLRKLINNSYLLARRNQMLGPKPDNLDSNLKTTAETLIHLFEPDQSIRMLQIVRGFLNSEAADSDSSINHIIALKVLIEFVENLRFDRRNLNITFKDDQNGSGDFQVNSDNYQVLQTLKISRRSRKININSKGYGIAIVIVKYKYNLECEDQNSSSVFSTNVTTWISPPQPVRTLRVLEFCPSVSSTNKSQNNLMVMEITLPSGYICSERCLLEDEQSKKGIKSIQINGNRDMVEVYIQNIDSKGVCFKLKALREYKVLNAKLGWIIMYDVHEKYLKIAKNFTIDDVWKDMKIMNKPQLLHWNHLNFFT